MQLMTFFGFFALVLVLLFWINRAVILFTQLISSGQSMSVFVEFTALTLPTVIVQVLPVAGVVATVFAANRLGSESELVAAQASGLSPSRLSRAVLVFGAVVALFTMVLSHVLVPASARTLSQRYADIQQNVTARFLRDGTFVHPSGGVTLYIREITPEGTMRDIFLDDRRSDARQQTYTSKEALIVNTEDGPRMVMLEGKAQTLDTRSQRLSTTDFQDFAYDISELIPDPRTRRRRTSDLTTMQLASFDAGLIEEARATPAQFFYEINARIAQGTFALAAVVMGFATMMTGGFSRFGMWRQILATAVGVALLKVIDGAALNIAEGGLALVPLVYLGTFLGLVAASVLLWVAARPALFTPRGRRALLRREAKA